MSFCFFKPFSIFPTSSYNPRKLWVVIMERLRFYGRYSRVFFQYVMSKDVFFANNMIFALGKSDISYYFARIEVYVLGRYTDVQFQISKFHVVKKWRPLAFNNDKIHVYAIRRSGLDNFYAFF